MAKKQLKQKTWTVILSSGPQAPVKQFRLSKVLFYSSLLFMSLLILGVVGLTYIINNLNHEKSNLHTKIERQETEIQEIKGEYITLQEEAAAVQKSIEQFKVLEERLRSLKLEMPQNISSGTDGGASGGVESSVTLVNHENMSDELMSMQQELPGLISKFEETYERLVAYENELKFIPTIFPAENGRITSQYGKRKDPFTGRNAYHTGIDIAAQRNTAILAAADGTVIYAGTNGGYGKMIKIKHGKYETAYAHLNEINVSIWDKVKKGDVIGKMGTTGRSTGVHLHYEIKLNGELLNPYPYITFYKNK